MRDQHLRKLWDGYARYYRKINLSPVYQQFIQDILRMAEVREGERCIDLGCGPGHVSRALAELQGQVFAVDYSRVMLNYASELSELESGARPKGRIQFINADVKEYLDSLSPVSINVAVASLLLAYMEDLDPIRKVCARIYEVLAPGGRFVMSNPVPRPSFQKVLWRSGIHALQHPYLSVRLLVYALKLKRLAEEGVVHFFSREETVDLFGAAGFERRRVEVRTSLADTVLVARAIK